MASECLLLPEVRSHEGNGEDGAAASPLSAQTKPSVHESPPARTLTRLLSGELMFPFYFEHHARSTATPPVAHIFTPRKSECLDSGTDSTRSRVDRNTWRKRSKNRERERTVTWYFNCSGTSLWKISSKTPPLEKRII